MITNELGSVKVDKWYTLLPNRYKGVSMKRKQRPIEPEYMSVVEVEGLTGTSRWTWRRWAYLGKISSVKVGQRLLIPVSEVQRVLAEGLRPRLTKKENVKLGSEG